MKNIEILRYINENSDYVSINKEKIAPFFNGIKNWNYNYWLDNEKINLSEKEFIIFSFICESMNFCFWGNRDWKVTYNDKEYIGSEALFYAILNEISRNPHFLEIRYLKKLRKSDLKKIMLSKGQLPELMQYRYKLLKETIKVIAQKGKTFFDELFSIKTDEELLEYIVKNFKHFDDRSKFKGKIIPFNKRAILLTNDLFRMSPKIRNNIKIIDNLTGGADYAIPKVLQENGILEYNEKLLTIIKSKKAIKHNSQMEIEIRANTLYALEIMKNIAIKQNINIKTIELDNIIWNTRKSTNSEMPSHHTKTIYY